MTLRGIVVRISDVKPSVEVVTYVCDACGFETYQIISQREFTPKSDCQSPVCKNNMVKGKMHMQVRGSKFVSY